MRFPHAKGNENKPLSAFTLGSYNQLHLRNNPKAGALPQTLARSFGEEGN